MKLENKDLMAEFLESISEEYPDLTLDDVRDICSGPWRFLKSCMESGELPEVRFKYFGVFVVYPGRVKNMLRSLKDRKSKNLINERDFEKYSNMLTKYLERNESDIK